MDDLKITLDTLSDDDKRELAVFIQREKKKKHRKDLELFQLLQQKKNHNPELLIQRLYPNNPNPVAYYALRKRLMRHITNFILLKRVEQDITAASPIMGMLSLAHYLFDEGRQVSLDLSAQSRKAGRHERAVRFAQHGVQPSD